MSHEQRYEIAAAEYGSDASRSVERVKTSKRRQAPSAGRRGKGPQSFNGMHRRRRRKITW
jgi:hypothetical protein